MTDRRARRARWVAVCVAALAAGCAPSSDEPRPPSVVVIVMDTVRQDRLSCYGYHRETTPFLEELAARSRVYTEAYSVSSWTPPAHASLFTGLHTAAHGSSQERWNLEPHLTTMAELLAERGYRTVGIVGNPLISRVQGFDQGFAEFHELWRGAPLAGGEHPALAWFRESLAAVPEDRPFFFFVNLIEAHSPYLAPEPFRRGLVSEPVPDMAPANLWREFYLGLQTFDEPQLRYLREMYDAEIRFVDHLVGEMAAALRAAGRWDDTIFVVTSDHGENIGDHGHMDHVFSLYESTIKIPLIVHYPPRFEPGSIDAGRVQITDVWPTLLGVLELDGAPPMQGRDLLRPDAGEERPVFCEYYRPVQAFGAFGLPDVASRLAKWDRHLRAVIHGTDKLIWASDGDHELYDLASDPDEARDRMDDPQGRAAAGPLVTLAEHLARSYREVRPESATGTDVEGLDEETIEALRSLGYLK